MAVILVMWEVIGRRIDVQSWPQAKSERPYLKKIIKDEKDCRCGSSCRVPASRHEALSTTHTHPIIRPY
jgi:hypothetical protein